MPSPVNFERQCRESPSDLGDKFDTTNGQACFVQYFGALQPLASGGISSQFLLPYKSAKILKT